MTANNERFVAVKEGKFWYLKDTATTGYFKIQDSEQEAKAKADEFNKVVSA